MEWFEILILVLGVLSGIFGAKWKVFLKLLKEMGDVCYTTSEAMDDGNISQEEGADIMREVVEAIDAGKDLFSK